MYLPSVVNTITYKIVCAVLPTSDTMFFLDVTPEESLRRIGSRDDELEMFENLESLTKYRENSKKFTYNWNVIDGNKTTGGLYGPGNDWFGHVGDTLVITFDREITLKELKLYTEGNYTFADVIIKLIKMKSSKI